MTDTPSNSRSPKAEPAEENKRVERVTTNPVVKRKTPLWQKFRETFLAGTGTSIGQYILFDVLAPALKDMVRDSVNGAVDRALYGTERRPPARPSSGQSSYVNYGRYSAPSTTPPWRQEPRRDERPQPRRRGSHDIGQIVLATRVEAEEVIDRLYSLISQYGSATVSDLYEMVGEESQFTDNKFGWTELPGARARRINEGYLLDLPRPEQLD